MGDQQTDIEIIPAGQQMDALTRAEIDIAIATAKQWPRDVKTFRDEVLSMATIDRETAAGCFYSLRRQGKTIQGPSVRLAEIATSAWGNIRAGARILGETPDGKFVSAIGICHDLQRNVYVQMESRRRITTSSGQKYGDDMIGVTSNAAAGVGFRNAVLKVIPKVFIDSVFRECVKIATGNAKTLKERREQVFERLKKLNPLITDERILAAVERPSIEEVTLDDVAHLIGLGTAIQDGEQSLEQAFPEIVIEQAVEEMNAKTGAAAEKIELPKKEAAGPKMATAEQVAELKRHAHALGVSFDELEGDFRGDEGWTSEALHDCRRAIDAAAKRKGGKR